MTVLVVGLSHRSAPAELLERAALGTDDVPKVLAELLAVDSIGEALLLATCNRLEVYADVSRFHGAVAEIGAILARTAGVSTAEIAEHGYVHFAEAASEHMLCVSAGLDSMVVGEAQILGQVRAAYQIADAEGSVGRELHTLVQSALRAGKRVHHETGIDRSGASLASRTGPRRGADRSLEHRIWSWSAQARWALVASRAQAGCGPPDRRQQGSGPGPSGGRCQRRSGRRARRPGGGASGHRRRGRAGQRHRLGRDGRRRGTD
jgi:hypothetical protein